MLETTISRLADGTALRQTIAAPKECRQRSQSGPRVRLPSGLCSRWSTLAAASAWRSRSAQWPRALISDVGWRAAAAKRDAIYWCAIISRIVNEHARGMFLWAAKG